MSILIPGMEMPTKCEECEWSTTDRSGFFGCRLTGNIVIRKREKDRPDWCPLVPVPPHGRLIDADTLMAYFENIADIEWNKKAAPISWSYAFEDVMDDIENAPTIIPASKEGEG